MDGRSFSSKLMYLYNQSHAYLLCTHLRDQRVPTMQASILSSLSFYRSPSLFPFSPSHLLTSLLYDLSPDSAAANVKNIRNKARAYIQHLASDMRVGFGPRCWRAPLPTCVCPSLFPPVPFCSFVLLTI